MARHFGSLGVAGVSLFLALTACSSAAPDTAAASDDVIQTAAPIKPVSLLTCWVKRDTSTPDAFFQVHELRCTRPDLGDYPLVQEEAIVEVRTAAQGSFYASVTDAETLIGRFRSSDLPLTLQTRLRFPRTATAGDAFTLKDQRTLTTLTDATRESPLALTSPFTLWGVALRDKTPGGRLFVSARYTAPTASFKVGFNFNIPETDVAQLNVSASQESVDGVAELALIAPESGDLALNINGREHRVAGPGKYVLDGETLTKEAGAAPAPTPDVVEPTPAPTCGVPDKPLCPGGQCATGHRLSSNACLPCGAAGQTYCGSYNDKTCAPDHRVVDETCRACGVDGQTYCGSYNNKTCAPGHRVADDVCRVCGADGQTYCGSYNDKTCSPGHRVESDMCRVCGGEGQTYCGTYDNKTCNEGLRVQGDRCVR